MKHRTLEATSKMLETFFSKTLGTSVTTDEIYAVWGRNTTDEQKNKSWLSTTIVHLKHHDLVKPIYERRNNRHTLVGIQLTEKGKNILGKNRQEPSAPVNLAPDHQPEDQQADLNYDSMLKLVARFKKENPQYQVTFNISLKEE